MFVMCPVEIMAGHVSLRVQQLDINCETKTSDNVSDFLSIQIDDLSISISNLMLFIKKYHETIILTIHYLLIL